MNRVLSAALVVATMAGAVAPADAMTYAYHAVGKDTLVIDAKGDIGPDAGKIFAAWLQAQPKDAMNRPHFAMILDSHGGNPFGAFDVGEAIRKNGGNTGVAENGQCASACVLLWAAGVQKSASLTSKIGVHGAYFDKTAVKAPTKEAADDAKNAPLFEATWTLEIAQQLKMYGAPDHVVVQAIMTPSKDMYWLTADDAKAWGATILDKKGQPIVAST
jgi:hypothetical protein